MVSDRPPEPLSGEVNAQMSDGMDDALLGELRELAAVHDPVPPGAIAAARSAIAWRTIDAELAELTDDSSIEARPVGVRSTATPTLLAFDAPSLRVELEVVEAGATRRVTGQLVPPGPARVEVRHGGGALAVEADEIGRFRAEGLAPGPVSLRCTAAAGVVETDWFLT